MNPIYPAQFHPTPPPPWPPALLALPPPSSGFWQGTNAYDRLRELHDTMNLATALKKELEMLMTMKDGKENLDRDITELLESNKIDLKTHEPMLLEAVNAVMSKLRAQLEPFRIVTDEANPWEEKSAAVRLGNKIQKYRRNKMWRKRKRKRVAQKLAKEQELYDLIDKEADEWRAREIAKDIAQRKVEKMKEIAKSKAKEEKKRLESELELALVVEKLQELRSIRIQKLKKQGHFLPEEDDKFLERVRAAFEEEERQANAAADTGAARDAIAIAEESRKSMQHRRPDIKEVKIDNSEKKESEGLVVRSEDQTSIMSNKESGKQIAKRSTSSDSIYESVVNLPVEYYHYYYGSNTDMGTLIEVRRIWDTYIRPGGSRIPGHWVQPPPPADDIWASYLVRPK